jgi:ABC-type uncharacterized transport system substrate-binding protein
MPPYEQAVQGIQHGLKLKGVDVRLDVYNIEGNIQKGTDVLKQIREKKTNLVFAVGTEAYKAVSSLSDIPIVTAMLVDPEGEGIVKNAPNVYGAYLKVPFEQQFELIKKIVPELNPIAIICWCEPGKKRVAAEAQPAAERKEITVVPIKIESIKNFPDALEQASRDSKALLMAFDNELYNSATSKELLLFSARNKFPLIAFAPNYVKSGALLSFSSDYAENGKSAANLGANILQNQIPGNRFVPTGEVWVAWNSNVAKTFGIRPSSEGEREIDETV